MRKYWRLYRAAFTARLQYRADLALGLVTALLMQVSALAFYVVVFNNVSSVGGWSPPRVLFLFGVVALALAGSELLFNGIWQLPQLVVSGELDRLLVYPLNSLLAVGLGKPELHAFASLLSGMGIIAWAFALQAPSVLTLVILPIWVVSAMLIYAALLVALSCLCFVAISLSGASQMLAVHLLGATRYPLHIYPEWLRFVLLSFCPLGVATYLPGIWLGGGLDTATVALLPPIAAVVAVAAAMLLWRWGLRSYQGAGN